MKESTIVVATVMESSRRLRKVLWFMPEDPKKEAAVDVSSIISYSDDTGTLWIKKGKSPYYGYKAHVSTDLKDRSVIGGHVTFADGADTTELRSSLIR